jgi:hypothetical protein
LFLVSTMCSSTMLVFSPHPNVGERFISLIGP